MLKVPTLIPQALFNQNSSSTARNFLAGKNNDARYVVLRIAFSLVMLADVSHLYTHRNLFLSTSLWPWFPVGPACLVWLAALGCLVFGFRAAVIVNWICCSIMLGIVASNGGFQQAAGDSVAIGIAFLLLVLPILETTVGRWLVAAYLTSIYLDSGIHKLLSPMWAGGFGVSAPMTFPSLVWIPTNWMAWFPVWTWRVMGYGVVAFEVLFGPLYFWKRTRVAALIAGILLHLGIAIIYPIPIFGCLMIALYVALLPEAWYRPLAWMFRREPQKRAIALDPRIIISAGLLWGLAIASVYTPRYLPVKLFRKAAWLTAGVANHEVFAEEFFTNYTYQLRLIGPDGSAYPYSRGNLLAWDVRDRVWELWWKRTQLPPVTLQDANAHLLSWARSKWNTVPVRIEGRFQKAVTRAIAPELFRQNDSVPWRSIGTIQGGTVEWQVAPQSGQEKLGDYMERIWQ